ncbi:MAG: coiled coil domain-containing protein [Gallionellaceae bacterium]|jgi:SMC interacting uncharacterized protein involved in chromosome segregation
MNEKELYKKKMKAQLDEWKADVDKLRAKASGASAVAQLKLLKLVKELDVKVEEGNSKLDKMVDAGEEKWESSKKSVETAWDSLKSSIKDVTAKFKQ